MTVDLEAALKVANDLYYDMQSHAGQTIRDLAAEVKRLREGNIKGASELLTAWQERRDVATERDEARRQLADIKSYDCYDCIKKDKQLAVATRALHDIKVHSAGWSSIRAEQALAKLGGSDA